MYGILTDMFHNSLNTVNYAYILVNSDVI